MIAFTTMMWMAEALGYDTAPMEGFLEDKVKSLLDIPYGVRVVGLLGIGKRKGPDKLYAGRYQIQQVCFAEKWGAAINL
jgi:nitroreductase